LIASAMDRVPREELTLDAVRAADRAARAAAEEALALHA
jgi:hypothetical protein